MNFKTAFAWIGLLFISITPVILLFALGPGNYSSITHTIGQITGLVGMTMFALTFLLSTRAKWIERIFGGLDKVYPIHSVLGGTSLILILMHPLFLVMKFLPMNIDLAAKYLLPGGLISVDFGIFALLGMILLIMITLYSSLRYHHWKISHEFLGIVFLLAVLHIFLVRQEVARDYIFTGYYVYAILVSTLGLGCYIYSLARTTIKGKEYSIEKVINLGDCYEVNLKPKKDGMTYKAGQFIFVKFHNKDTGKESHPFSIASPSGNGNITIIMKKLGDFTGNLDYLKAGDKVIVEGPYGMFHQEGYGDEVWVAGGIGITPFLALAQDFRYKKKGTVDLYYSVKSREEFVHLKELESIAKNNNLFKIYPWVSNDQGRIRIDDIEKRSGKINAKKYYLCGPESLKVSIANGLKSKGVLKKNIYDERFAFK